MSILLDGIALPDDLIWIDEYDHTPITQTVSKAVDGSLIIEAATQAKGRPITLKGDENAAWIDRTALEKLRGMPEADVSKVLGFIIELESGSRSISDPPKVNASSRPKRNKSN